MLRGEKDTVKVIVDHTKEVGMYVYVCMYACMYVCMYACMYVQWNLSYPSCMGPSDCRISETAGYVNPNSNLNIISGSTEEHNHGYLTG